MAIPCTIKREVGRIPSNVKREGVVIPCKIKREGGRIPSNTKREGAVGAARRNRRQQRNHRIAHDSCEIALLSDVVAVLR